MASKRSSLKAKPASQAQLAVDHSGPEPGNPPAGETRSVPSLEKESNTLDWLEALPDAALVVDERGEIRRANAIAATMFGCASDDLIGKPVETLMPERSRASHGKHRAGFSAAQRPHPMGERRELQISRLDGTELSADISLSPLKLASGDFTLAILRDITERKQAEQALKESESRLSSIIGSSKDGVIFLDGKTQKIIFGNGTMAELLGCSKEDLVGRSIPSLHPSEEWARINQEFQKHMSGVLSLSTGIPVLRNDGSVFYADIRYSLIMFEGKSYISAFFRDITESKFVEKALRESEERFRRLSEAAFEGIVIHDEGFVLTANDQYYKMFGYEPEELLGKQALPLTVTPEALGGMRQQIIKGSEGPYESIGRKKDGTNFPIEIRGRNVEYEGRKVRVAAIVDITERKQAEQEIRKLNSELELRVRQRTAELESANKDLESFSYSVSHDLRAPLRAISGFAAIVSRRYRHDLNEEGQHYVDNIVLASERMGHLIDDLLQYSRLGRSGVRREQVSLREVFDPLASDLAASLEEIGGTLSITNDLPTIIGDKTLLSQAFANLLENSITYRKLEVPVQVTVSCQTKDKDIIVCVSDNGIGIPPEHYEKIFNIFQRLHSDDEYPGTGIGLSTVKKSVELLRGRVWVESMLGEGSKFFVQLPKE